MRQQINLDPIRPSLGHLAEMVGTTLTSIISQLKSGGMRLEEVVRTIYEGFQATQDQINAINTLLRNRYSTFIDPSQPPFVGPWNNVVYSNSWVDYGGGFAPVSYRYELGGVRLRGPAKNGTAADGTVIFTLPPGYRPPYSPSFAVAANAANTVAQIAVGTDGTVRVYGLGGVNTYVRFDGVTFELS